MARSSSAVSGSGASWASCEERRLPSAKGAARTRTERVACACATGAAPKTGSPKPSSDFEGSRERFTVRSDASVLTEGSCVTATRRTSQGTAL